MARPIAVHDLSKISAAARGRLLVRSEEDLSGFVERVKPIVAAVKAEGDAALARFAGQFDQAPITADAIRTPESDFEDALQYFSATEAGVKIILTRNVKDYKYSELAVMTPEIYIRQS